MQGVLETLQEALTVDFLQRFQDTLHQLPKVSKSQLVTVPTLMEFICVNNPLSLEKYAPKPTRRTMVRKGSIDDSPSRKSRKEEPKQHRETQYNMKR